MVQISTHTPLAGRDALKLQSPDGVVIFLLTRPSRDVTISGTVGKNKEEFLLTRPSRDVTKQRLPSGKSKRISTHTPLAGRDRAVGVVPRDW